MSEALVSVITPVYNREDVLAECLDSILNQTHKNLEVLLIDDGSTDKTLGICGEYAEKDCRVRLIKANHSGASAARNLGLEKARGEWIFFLDSDDAVHPRTLEELLDALSKTGAKIGGTAVLYLPKNGWNDYIADALSTEDTSGFKHKPFEEALDLFFKSRTPINLIGGDIMSRDLIGETRFRPDIFIGEDTYFIYQNLIKGADCVYLDKRRYIGRQHDNQVSKNYNFEGFYTRFFRHKLVWKQELELGRTQYAALQKKSIMGVYNRCIRRGADKTEAKKMRRVLKENRKELASAYNLPLKLSLLSAIYLPDIYIAVVKTYFSHKKGKKK